MTEETKKQLIIIYSIFKNNNINIKIEGVKNTPFIKYISCIINYADITNINKIKSIFKTIETLLNTNINYNFNNDVLIIKIENQNNYIFNFQNYFKNNELLKNKNLVFLGLDSKKKPVYESIKNLKSILIGGSSGSGKSILLHNIILSYLLLNDFNYLMLIDPKYTELNLYNKRVLKNRLILETQHEKNNILKAIDIFINIIKKRFKKMQKLKQQTSTENTILLIIDEYANITNTTKERNILNEKISYIASIGRAANCFLILTTQHATNKNINTTIRNNLQTKIALHCESINQSKNLIDSTQAVKLTKTGSFLLKTENTNELKKIQSCYISNEFLLKILNKS